jgi:hypothetical protein
MVAAKPLLLHNVMKAMDLFDHTMNDRMRTVAPLAAHLRLPKVPVGAAFQVHLPQVPAAGRSPRSGLG